MKTYEVTIQVPNDGVSGMTQETYTVEARNEASAKAKALKKTGIAHNPDVEVISVISA